ncbi:hypothetical protein PAHAL_8G082300 [Panicum hallii]|uniref:Uncharacterized protein n=1 Tax=Panicum hallii TaxID=206008 RepID=A0A2T8I878_9POAL|nr:hypothetical protein PAHAL_8G082300 [Panicum hallii]
MVLWAYLFNLDEAEAWAGNNSITKNYAFSYLVKKLVAGIQLLSVRNEIATADFLHRKGLQQGMTIVV